MEYQNTLFGCGQLFADFYFHGGLETQSPRKARDDRIYLFISIVHLRIVVAPYLHLHHVRTPMLLIIRWPHEASLTGFVVALTSARCSFVVALTSVRCSFVLMVKFRQDVL
jgi:hypothetical protein